MSTMLKSISKILFYGLFVALTAVLSTVFVTDNFLWQGVTTAKYFWFAGAVCIASLLSSPLLLTKKVEIHITDVLIGILALYAGTNYFCLNNHPDIYRWLALLMIPLYVAVRTAAGNEIFRRWILLVLLVVVLVEAVWGLLQLYGFAHSNHSLYKITGTLFNPGPYSGFVAVGMLLALSFALDKQLPKWERWLGMITLGASALVLPAAMSRAAWIAAFAGCVMVLWKWFRASGSGIQVQGSKYNILSSVTRHLSPVTIRVVIITVVGVLAVGSLVGTYLMKKDSADGRWLIWNASMESVKEHPLFGAGYGRFAAVYGDTQATYLGDNRTPAQEMVADSPEYAFNEYVQIAVELGLVGLALFLLAVGSPFITRNLKRASKPETQNSKPGTALITFLVFAVFSYPFSVLPLFILFVFLLALSAPSSYKLSSVLPGWLCIIGIAACWGIAAYGAYQILPKRTAYREWSSLQVLYNANAYKEAAKEYRAWYPKLCHEKQFLFEYGQCLSKTGEYAESNRIFEQYLCYGSDPMVYNCIGNNFKAMGKYNQAENAYIRASQIVPNRHYPLYLLMKLYRETGQTTKAKTMAKTLLEKPVKVSSTAIREMQEEAKEIMKSEE